MRRNFLPLVALIVASGLLFQIGCQEQATPEQPAAALAGHESAIGQEEAEAVPEVNQPAPKITFENLVHDFGEVSPRTKQVGEFKFTNTGDSLLKITEVKKCCGVVAKLDKEEFAPGQSGTLKVEYRSGQRAGTMRKQLHVNSNDEENPNVALTIKAKIVPKVAYEPQRLKLSLKGENAGCPEITLSSLDNQPFSIKAFKSTGDSITADIDSSVEATKFVLQPNVDFEKLQSLSSGLINIGLTHPECDRASIYFSLLPKFRIVPQSIILTNAEPQRPTVKKVVVQSNYDEDFEVESVSSKNGSVKVLDQERILNGYRFEVEINPPPRDEDKARFTDVLYVNLKGGERLEIRSYGRLSRQ